MRTNNSAVFLLLLLFFFLALATAPPALVFAHYYGVLPLPQLDYGSVMIFATAALFLLPVFFVLFAAVAMLLKKKKERGGVVGVVARKAPKPEHYPWEGVFRAAEKEEFKAARAKVKAAFAAPKLNVTALLVVAVIVAATVIFFVIVVPTAKDVFTTGGKGSNLTNLTKLSTVEDASNASNAVKNESTLLQFFKTKLSNLRKTNITGLAEEAKLAEAKKLAEVEKAKQKQEKEAKQKEGVPSSFSALAMKFKAAAATVSKASKVKVFWPYALVGVGVLVLLAVGFYSYKTKKIKPAAEWLRACVADSADWLVVLFAEMKRNSLKLLISAVVIAVAALAFVFRNWLKVKLSVFSKAVAPVLATIREPSVSIFYAAKNFLSAYRLYIIIGVAALLVILGVLFLFERREKGKGLEPAAPTAPKKSGPNKRGSSSR